MIESLVSSAISIVLSLASLLTLVTARSELFTVAISLVFKSSETLTAESLASLLTLVTVLSALLLVSTAPSFIAVTLSLAS